MAIPVEGKTFEPPPEGMHNAVCVDVVDRGMVEGQFGVKRKLQITWELDARMADGRPWICSKWYTASTHEKSTLRKDLKAWRGKDLSLEEQRRFDIERVLGAPCRLVIQHEERDGTVYGRVVSILRADPARRLHPSGDFVRVQDRADYVPPQRPRARPQAAAAPADAEEFEVPWPDEEEVPPDNVPF